MIKKFMSKMLFRFPDKPNLVGPAFFDIIDDQWIIESKLDGYRVLIIKENDKIRAVSRHNKPLNISKDILDLLAHIPNNTVIDGEWVNPSRIKAINNVYNYTLREYEALALFDIMYWSGVWLGSQTLNDRLKHGFWYGIPTVEMSKIDSIPLFRMPYAIGCAKSFFEMQRKYLISEGIVAKKLHSVLVGSSKNSADNPGWYKIKLRDS